MRICDICEMKNRKVCNEFIFKEEKKDLCQECFFAMDIIINGTATNMKIEKMSIQTNSYKTILQAYKVVEDEQ